MKKTDVEEMQDLCDYFADRGIGFLRAIKLMLRLSDYITNYGANNEDRLVRKIERILHKQ